MILSVIYLIVKGKAKGGGFIKLTSCSKKGGLSGSEDYLAFVFEALLNVKNL